MKQQTKADEGFTWITNRSTTPYVTIDKQRRIYISKPARDLLGVPDGRYSLIAGYDFANNRVVLAKPDIVRVPNVKPFKFDKRSYSNARNFVERARLGDDLPVRFVFAGKDYAEYPSGAFVFTREGHASEDA